MPTQLRASAPVEQVLPGLAPWHNYSSEPKHRDLVRNPNHVMAVPNSAKEAEMRLPASPVTPRVLKPRPPPRAPMIVGTGNFRKNRDYVATEVAGAVGRYTGDWIHGWYNRLTTDAASRLPQPPSLSPRRERWLYGNESKPAVQVPPNPVSSRAHSASSTQPVHPKPALY
jgi:hypothetical protein